MKVRRGMSDVLPAPASQFPVGSVGDQYNTCVAAGGDAISCAAAVFGVGSGASGSGAPSWLIAGGIGLLVAMLFMGGGRR